MAPYEFRYYGVGGYIFWENMMIDDYEEFIKDLVKMMQAKKVNVAISAHGNSIRLFRKIMEKASVKEAVSWTIPYEEYFEYTV